MVTAYGVGLLRLRQSWGGAVLLVVAIKLASEGADSSTAALIDTRVATEAHRWGSLSGLIAALFAPKN